MSNATQTYREVQRKANAGERIKIVNAHLTEGKYANGDELTAVNIRTVRGEQRGVYAGTRKGKAYIFDDEYVVLEPSSPVIAPTTANLPDLFAQFIRDNAPAVRSYLAEIDPDKCAEPTEDVAPPAPLTRAKVIEMARERVAELLRIGRDDDARLEGNAKFRGAWFEIDFVVNRDKRAVTALVYELSGLFGAYTRKRRKPDAVGIAKCAPDDVFNADLGKAIAAERALGLTLTDAFVNAPKPDNSAVGMRVRKIGGVSAGQTRTLTRKVNGYSHDKYGYNCFETDYGFWIGDKQYVIIDDTDADYSQEAGEAA